MNSRLTVPAILLLILLVSCAQSPEKPDFGWIQPGDRAVSMSYNSALDIVFKAASAQMKDMGVEPGEKSQVGPLGGELFGGSTRIVLAPREGDAGTVMSVGVDPANSAAEGLAREFLIGTAQRLLEYVDIARDYDANIKPVWEAVLAQIGAMEGVVIQDSSMENGVGRIHLRNSWLEVHEVVADRRTRVHVGGVLTQEGNRDKAEAFFAGVGRRLGR